jgi:hypothetical protein
MTKRMNKAVRYTEPATIADTAPASVGRCGACGRHLLSRWRYRNPRTASGEHPEWAAIREDFAQAEPSFREWTLAV